MSERVRDVLLNLVVAGLLLGDRRADAPAVDARRHASRRCGRPPAWRSRRCCSAAQRLLPGIAARIASHDGGFACRSGRRCSSPAAASSKRSIDVTLLRRFAFDARLERVRDVVLLGLVVAPVGAFVAAIVGTYGDAAGRRVPRERLLYSPGALVDAQLARACRSSSRW